MMCFDHNLKKLWDVNLQEDFLHNAHHREIAIYISDYTLKYGDSGLVIVGGRMEPQPHVVEASQDFVTLLLPTTDHLQRYCMLEQINQFTRSIAVLFQVEHHLLRLTAWSLYFLPDSTHVHSS